LQVSVRLGQPTLPNGINDSQISSNRTQPLDNGIITANGNRSVNGQARSLEENPELQAALSELERGRSREYYNEDQDRQNREEYYSNLPDSLNRTKLFNNLSSLLQRTHTTWLEYKPSTHLYPFVDLRPGNLKLQSIYSGNEFEPEEFIREAFQIEELIRRFQESITTESAMNEEQRAAQLDLLEASMPFNCEHVVPQSWFTRREPMRGDLHHLFACEPDCNSFRSNIPFFDFPDFGERIRDKCGKREEKKFEPSAGKGAVARATLYFLLRYPEEINRSEFEESRLRTLLNWHENEPPTKYEKHRNMAIFEKQGNRNPLIDFPDWADRIEWRLGLG
jgi:endonuclease I